MTAKRELTDLITVLNSTSGFGKYPIGNKELTAQTRALESDGLIQYDALRSKWHPRTSTIFAPKECSMCETLFKPKSARDVFCSTYCREDHASMEAPNPYDM